MSDPSMSMNNKNSQEQIFFSNNNHPTKKSSPSTQYTSKTNIIKRGSNLIHNYQG